MQHQHDESCTHPEHGVGGAVYLLYYLRTWDESVMLGPDPSDPAFETMAIDLETYLLLKEPKVLTVTIEPGPPSEAPQAKED